MEQMVSQKGYVSVVDLLMGMNKLSPKDYEAWRKGQVPYLEKVMMGSLAQLSFLMSIYRTYARELGLRPSWTAYQPWGKGKKGCLWFSKFGSETIERAYATHYLTKKE